MGTVFVTWLPWRFPLVHRFQLHRCCDLRSEATSKALKHLLTVLRRVPAPVNSLRPEPGQAGHRPWHAANAAVPKAARVRPGLVELPVAQHRQSFLEAGVAGYHKIWKEIITNQSVDKWSQKLDEIDTWRKQEVGTGYTRQKWWESAWYVKWTHQAQVDKKEIKERVASVWLGEASRLTDLTA